MYPQFLVLVLMGVSIPWLRPVCGHGRLWEPPGRSTMWKRGFNTPINYQDHELFCGGFSHQVSLGYKCGICGDPYDGPRENEANGKYATGLISRTYEEGQEVDFEIDLTANHKGFFEFKVCPTNNPTVAATQECLDRHVITLAGTGEQQFQVRAGMSGILSMKVKLPDGLTCEQCVVQWRYHAGNSWGTDPDRRSCVGCGMQEEFYGCSDVRIVPRGQGRGSTVPSSIPTTMTTSADTTTSADKTTSADTTTSTDTTTVAETTTRGEVIPTSDIKCVGVLNIPNLGAWCQRNCERGFCPQSHCSCVSADGPTSLPLVCRASPIFAKAPGYDSWCYNNCRKRITCPPLVCVCNNLN